LGKRCKKQKSWQQVSQVVLNVFKNGKDGSYRSVRQRTQTVQGHTVEVIYSKVSNSTKKISNA